MAQVYTNLSVFNACFECLAESLIARASERPRRHDACRMCTTSVITREHVTPSPRFFADGAQHGAQLHQQL